MRKDILDKIDPEIFTVGELQDIERSDSATIMFKVSDASKAKDIHPEHSWWFPVKWEKVPDDMGRTDYAAGKTGTFVWAYWGERPLLRLVGTGIDGNICVIMKTNNNHKHF